MVARLILLNTKMVLGNPCFSSTSNLKPFWAQNEIVGSRKSPGMFLVDVNTVSCFRNFRTCVQTWREKQMPKITVRMSLKSSMVRNGLRLLEGKK